ncbi:hypothetical protein [Arthrobacter crystallopoietes]|jgi:hypothetical protein|uniref:hypothetical protein n=1 Tax=Crystallibacter crystallopoietes TaxID=37928 RepID=UPI00111134AD|nr:hypothetical protein [Arthrobacter crystallopoietes]QTG80546.1 hypothetical protein J5251_17220 [Arthrobacter crystallopoietes]
MPRSNRPRRRTATASRKWAQGAELDLDRARAGIPERQSAPDGEWNVRRITPGSAAKDYTCPGCGQMIRPGVEHLVAWRQDSLFGAETALAERRHWHPHCWKTRSFRYR